MVLLTAQLGCFREADAHPAGEPTGGPVGLSVHDPGGTPYTPDEAPRDPSLTLHFPADPPASASAVRLVPGRLSPAFAERVAAQRGSGRLAAQAIDCTLQRHARDLALRPSQPLTPGADYTLLWLGDAPRAYPLTVSASAALGARLAETWPGDGESAAPLNLLRVLARFDGHVRGALGESLVLRDAAGMVRATRAHAARCSALGLPEGDCVWLTPEAPLSPGRYQLSLEPGLETLTGAALAPHAAAFEIVAAPDETAPSLTAPRCEPDEHAQAGLCMLVGERAVSLRGGVDEPAWITARTGAATRAQLARARAIELADVPLGDDRALALELVDLAGNVRALTLTLDTPPPLATVAIDEVRADPRGKEPAQEYVELLNFGEMPVSLQGFTLTTDATERARVIAEPVRLAPGERALVVGPDFDPDDTREGALPSGVQLARTSAALSLPNAGVALRLRDAQGRRLSAAPSLTPLIEGQCIGRRGGDLRSGARTAFALDPDGGCTPGRASFDAR